MHVWLVDIGAPTTLPSRGLVGIRWVCWSHDGGSECGERYWSEIGASGGRHRLSTVTDEASFGVWLVDVVDIID